MEYRQLKQRMMVFAVAHPWSYGAVVGGGFMTVLLLMLHLGPVVALLGGVVWSGVTGTSMRFGPGRQVTQRRLAGLRDAAPRVQTRFGTTLWHKIALGFVGLFVLWIAVALVAAGMSKV